MYELKEVTKVFAYGETEVRAVDGITVSIPERKFVVITGKSGSGKTTLLNLMAGFSRPSAGEVWCDGKNITGFSSKELSFFQRSTIGVVFQFFRLIPVLNCHDNIWIANEFAERADKNHVKSLVDRLEIGPLMHKYPSELSGGQMQRVAIARALINRPDYLLADEPTGNLDSSTGKQVTELLKSTIDDFGASVIMVTHDADIAADADVQIHLEDGHIHSIIEKKENV